MILPGIFLALLLVYSNALSYRSLVEEQWQEFKLKHQKTYASENEEQYRMRVFMDNMHTILEHNKLYELGESTYHMGMNQFGDLTDDEFHRFYSMPYNSTTDQDYDELPKEKLLTSSGLYLPEGKYLPKEIDWRIVKAVTRVKNQGQCGSCYAFSATGALEAHYFFKSKKLVSLSEQNIVDCTYQRKKYENNGCLGGRVDKSFQYIIDSMGIDTEESYPYIADRNRRCRFNKSSIGARMSSFVNLPPGNEKELQKAVAFKGPVAVMVDNKNMRFYAKGIYDDPSCSSKEYTHGMLVIGYGTYEKLDYWLLKNSWGEDWGEVGYIMMIRNKNNRCAIATAALYPVI